LGVKYSASERWGKEGWGTHYGLTEKTTLAFGESLQFMLQGRGGKKTRPKAWNQEESSDIV